MPRSRPGLRLAALLVALPLAILLGAATTLPGTCGPFTDVAADVFCPFVLEIFYLGITTGTSATTYDPASLVNRLQMAAFLSRTVDSALRRGSRRAALDRFWAPGAPGAVALTTVGTTPYLCRCDGADVWVANYVGNTVSRVRGSDGKLLETWTGAGSASGVLIAMGRVLVSGGLGVGQPGAIYSIDPSQAAGAVTTVASTLGTGAYGIAFDGARVWTANTAASVSIVTPGAIPWTVTTVGGFTFPTGALFDGTNVWITDYGANKLQKLGPAGAVLQTVTTPDPQSPVFDGTNIWVPNGLPNSVTVVRASSGAILQVLTGNGLSGPYSMAFDGQRVLAASGSTVSLWKAADLTPLGSTAVAGAPYGSCSDGLQFWITLYSNNQLARF